MSNGFECKGKSFNHQNDLFLFNPLQIELKHERNPAVLIVPV